MTRDEIIKLAKDARLCDPSPYIAPWPNQLDMWERFAALVAAAEREACAKVCEDGVRDIGEAVIIGDDRRDASINACTNLAKRIRARNQSPRVGDHK